MARSLKKNPFVEWANDGN
nr:ribosomal protein S19 [Cuphea micropetala]UPQ43904.1 ribosomal protein S19 [Cuphea micropetala]